MSDFVENQNEFIPIPKATISRGSTHVKKVMILQTFLRDYHGYSITVDGIFGPQTERIVREFQAKNNLMVDGIVGPKTWSLLAKNKEELESQGIEVGDEYYPPETRAKILSQKDIERAAKSLEVSVPSIMAVSEVESRGSGFFSNNKAAILYERHWMRQRMVFYKVDPVPHQNRHPNLVSTASGGYFGGVREYERLDAARKIHNASAIESCSWGAYQIMGFHWSRLKYPSLEDFYQRMQLSEGEHLEAFVRFIKADPVIHRALKQQDWRTFALRYNGPKAIQRGYDRRMATAFNKYRQNFR